MEFHWHPNDRRLRQFGILCMLFSSALLVRWSSLQLTSPPLIAALVFLIGTAGFFKPAFLRPLYVGWMIAVFPIGWSVSKLTLAVLFYGVFMPLGLFFRIMRRDELGLNLQPETDSYWISKETPDDPGRYFQQF